MDSSMWSVDARFDVAFWWVREEPLRVGWGREDWGLRRALLVVLGLLAGALLNSGLAGAQAHAGQAGAVSRNDCYRVASERFVFHSDPWINLHHFLFQWARNVPERPAGDRRRAIEIAEWVQVGDLNEAERRSWERALGSYRDRLIGSDLLFGRDLITLRGKLAAVACSTDGVTDGSRPLLGGTSEDPWADIDAEVRAVLQEAMTVYRRRWWRGHRARITAWIQERLEQLETYEAVFSQRLAAAYGGEWPAKRVRVDVTAYANWAGAYTTNHPDHVTIETDYEGLEGLETLFHEVSHAGFFEQRVLGDVNAAFQALEAKPPNRLSHAIQFATPAEILRKLLGEEERDGFRSVAEQVNERGPFREQYAIILKHWRRFLDGQVERSEALSAIAGELAAR